MSASCSDFAWAFATSAPSWSGAKRRSIPYQPKPAVQRSPLSPAANATLRDDLLLADMGAAVRLTVPNGRQADDPPHLKHQTRSRAGSTTKPPGEDECAD